MKVNEIVNEAYLTEGPLGFLGKLFGKSAGKGASKAAGKAAGKATAKATAKDVGKAAATGVSKVSGLTYNKFMSAFGGFSGLAIKLITADALYEFYKDYKNIVTQKEQYDAGDKSTELFGNLSPEDVKQKYDNELNSIVGKAVIIAAPQLRIPGVAGKFGSWIVKGGMAGAGGTVGFMFGGPGGAMAGAAAGGAIGYASLGIIKAMSSLLSKGISGVAFVSFVNSDAGQKFFSDMLHGELLSIIGGNARSFYNSAATILQSFMKGFNGGTSDTQSPDATGTTGTADQHKQTAAAPAATAASPNLTPEQSSVEKEFNAWPLKITFKGKQAFVNGMPVSDNDGYRTVGEYALRNYKTTAQHMGKEFPMQIIPPKPGKEYYN